MGEGEGGRDWWVVVWHGQGTGGVGWIPTESWCCTSGTCPSGRVTFGLGGGGRQGGRGESPCHSPFGDAGRAGSPGNGDGYGGTRDLARCRRPHENEPPRGPFGGGGAPTTTATPRTTTTPSDFCIGGCVWMGASMEWHRGGDTGFEGLVRAVQSTENAHFNEASKPVVQDCGHSGEIPEG